MLGEADKRDAMSPSSGRERGTQPALARSAKPVSLHTIERLSVYRRMLEELSHDGVEFIHSQQLAALVGVTPAQLRRDLASFGSFGNIARGYNVYQMGQTISRIIGTDKLQSLALFGLGDLGRALLSYHGFEERGFHVAVAFDVDQDKIGRVFAGRRCYGLQDLETVMTDFDVRMAVLCSRPEGLQAVVDRAAAAGVRSFLNFVPKRLITPKNCFVEHVDISAKLEKLSFLSQRQAAEE
jgi:redox-sensing transcriptional repressor